jgi:hypothetical protein
LIEIGQLVLEKILHMLIWFSPIVAPPDPWGPYSNDLCQFWLKLAQWFWRRFLNDPIPFLHFCDYLPFEEDLALI